MEGNGKGSLEYCRTLEGDQVNIIMLQSNTNKHWLRGMSFKWTLTVYSYNCSYIICKKIVNNKIIFMNLNINRMFLFSAGKIKPIYNICNNIDNCSS